jgi:hypothetical protein
MDEFCRKRKYNVLSSQYSFVLFGSYSALHAPHRELARVVLASARSFFTIRYFFAILLK